MKLFKKGWWKIQPKGSGNGANAFMFMDESGDEPKIILLISKKSKPEERA